MDYVMDRDCISFKKLVTENMGVRICGRSLDRFLDRPEGITRNTLGCFVVGWV